MTAQLERQDRLEALYEKHRPHMYKRPLDGTWTIPSNTMQGRSYEGIDWREKHCPCAARANCWHIDVARMADERLIPEGEDAMAFIRQRSAERKKTRFVFTEEQVVKNMKRLGSKEEM